MTNPEREVFIERHTWEWVGNGFWPLAPGMALWWCQHCGVWALTDAVRSTVGFWDGIHPVSMPGCTKRLQT